MALNANFGIRSLLIILQQQISPMMLPLMLIITFAGKNSPNINLQWICSILGMFILTQMDLGVIQQIQIKLGKLVFQNYVVQVKLGEK